MPFYDNRATFCREYWSDGRLVERVDALLLEVVPPAVSIAEEWRKEWKSYSDRPKGLEEKPVVKVKTPEERLVIVRHWAQALERGGLRIEDEEVRVALELNYKYCKKCDGKMHLDQDTWCCLTKGCPG